MKGGEFSSQNIASAVHKFHNKSDDGQNSAKDLQVKCAIGKLLCKNCVVC